jgi:HAD superfamily hydrolase (TIGR01549 family)
MPTLQLAPVTLKPVVLCLRRHSRAALRGVRYGVEHILDSGVLPGLQPSVALDVMPAMRPVVLTRRLVRNRKPMIKAVIFDLYETLVTQSGTVVPRAGALGESLGLDPTAYRREWKQLRPLALRGQLTLQQALVEAGIRLGVTIPDERVQHARDARIRANTSVFQKIEPDIVALTRDLHGRGVRLAAISNCMAEDVMAWPSSAFAPQFGYAAFSFAVGCVKPDPRIYLTTIEQLGVNAAETVYIGDGGDDELAGAERAGLRAAQARWFVQREAVPGIPFLATPQDVMSTVMSLT